MSTNLEYRARERQRKRESRRQASEAQREKGRQRSRARDKKQKRHFFVGRVTWKFCGRGDKMRNASGHQCEVKMSGSGKKVNEIACVLESVSIWFRSKERPVLAAREMKWEPKNERGGRGGEGRKRLQINPSILKTCVRWQRLIDSASRTILYVPIKGLCHTERSFMVRDTHAVIVV